MNKVQLTLSPEEVQALQTKADLMGYSVTKYIKLLIGKEVLSLIDEYPTIELSRKALKKIEQGHKEHQEGKTILINKAADLDNV